MWIGPLAIEYDDRVLTPRPWTAEQAAWAADISEELPAGPLLELCCGVGHIGLLAARLTRRPAVLVDSNRAAWRLARDNARSAGLSEVVEVRHGTVEGALAPKETFPLVLVDPPYVPSAETGLFPDDPRDAIDGGPDGLDLARVCLAVATRHLAPGGAVILQLRDAEQAHRIGRVTTSLHVAEVRIVADKGALVRLQHHRERLPA
jgi:release factor glutamine methyltransferase